MHIFINNKAKQAGTSLISQTDMVLIQYLLVGFQVTSPKKFGIVGNKKSFENLIHFVRVIGSLLGIKDEFNCCGETLEETISRCEEIKEEFLKPNFVLPTEEYLKFSRIIVEGMWYYDPTFHFDKILFLIQRELGIPGYHYFESERNDVENNSVEGYKELSRYTRFLITKDIIIFQYLTRFIVFRVLFNLYRGFLRIFSIFPFLSIRKFGFKFSFKVFKTKYF